MMKPGVGTIILAMSLTGWIGMARFIRNQIIIIRDREYNLASRCLGTPVYRIILRNLLPYLVSVVMLRMALSSRRPSALRCSLPTSVWVCPQPSRRWATRSTKAAR